MGLSLDDKRLDRHVSVMHSGVRASLESGLSIILFQTADPIHYREMLAATSRTAIEFCRRHGHGYESYLGIKRGVWPWQASFNRIFQYKELMERGHRGWAVHLDADAYIHDLDFDLEAYLADKADRAAVLIPVDETADPCHINSGVSLINLGHHLGRELVRNWMAALMDVSDERLAELEHWPEDTNDQTMLHVILRDTARIREAVHFESPTLINSERARFIRQKLRAYLPNQQERTRALTLLVDEMLGAGNGESAAERLGPVVVSAAYRAVLHRDADAGGLADASAHIRDVGLEQGIYETIANMLASPEYRTLRERLAS